MFSLFAAKPADPAENQIHSARRARSLLLGAVALLLVLATLGFLFLNPTGEDGVYSSNTCVLLYHLIEDETYGENEYLFVRTDDFEAQLQKISERGLPSVFADDPWCRDGAPCVALTFDDGYESIYTNAFPLLQKYGICATVFVHIRSIDTPRHLTAAQMAEMEASGLVRFGSHTVSHCKLTTVDRETARQELLDSREALEALLGHPVCSVAYPEGASDAEIRAIASDCGYTYAYTTDPPRKGYYQNNNLPRRYVTREMSLQDFAALLPE